MITTSDLSQRSCLHMDVVPMDAFRDHNGRKHAQKSDFQSNAKHEESPKSPVSRICGCLRIFAGVCGLFAGYLRAIPVAPNPLGLHELGHQAATPQVPSSRSIPPKSAAPEPQASITYNFVNTGYYGIYIDLVRR